MADINNVARYIISNLSGDIYADDVISLLYYVNAWHLVYDNEVAFINAVCATDNGIIIELFDDTDVERLVTEADTDDPREDLDPSVKETIDLVMSVYGQLIEVLPQLITRELPYLYAYNELVAHNTDRAILDPGFIKGYYAAKNERGGINDVLTHNYELWSAHD